MPMQIQNMSRFLVLLLLYKSVFSTEDFKGLWLHRRNDFADGDYLFYYACSNFPPFLAGKVSSADYVTECVRLYDKYNCVGKYIELHPSSSAGFRLSDRKFDKKAMSVGPCSTPCPLQILDQNSQVTIFNEIDHKGSYLDINVSGCTPIPIEYHNETKSIQTNDECVKLYETDECIDSPDVKTVEFEPKSHLTVDISKYLKSPVVKAISRCDYKCLKISFVIPKAGDVFLFRSRNFTGDNHNFSVLNSECIHLPNSWVGKAESIGLGINTCVILYDRKKCSGKQLNTNESISNLAAVRFGGRIRSIRPCEIYLTTTGTTTTGTTKILTQNYSTIFSIGSTEMPTTTANTTEHNKYNRNEKTNTTDVSPLLIAVLVVVPLVAIVLSVVAFCVFTQCNPNRTQNTILSEKEIREFLSGMGIDLMAAGSGSSRENDYSTEFLAQNSAYNMEYELARSNIEIEPGSILGSGEFGIVYKGNLTVRQDAENAPSTSTGKKTVVAIKTVNQTSGLNGIRSLLKEVKVMLYMGQHTNIAKLIGCCTDKIREGDIMVVMEYCSEGSLESYLKKNRMSFNNLVKKGNLELESRNTTDLTETDGTSFDTLLIIQWGLEIARGMQFLSDAKVVHSDLAARNILLDNQLVAKISDFGLSRQLYAYSQYMKKHQEPLPFRWMAIESLKCLEFSTKSDVWSYGVLVWEMFSLGEKPYPGLGWNEAFISNLESGLRLAKPKNSTNEFYNLMLRCWDENPAGRPAFMAIVEEIQEMKSCFSSDAYTTL